MKFRMLLPVGLLTCAMSFGGMRASASDIFRFVAEGVSAAPVPAPVEEPAPMEEGKFDVGHIGCGEVAGEPWCCPSPWQGCLARMHCLKMNFHSRLGACCESLKAQVRVPPFCGPCMPSEPACGFEMKGDACQKGCDSTFQKGGEAFSLPCRPRLHGWGKVGCEPACGVDVKGGLCQKDCGPQGHKGCEPFALTCRPRLWGWNKALCDFGCGTEVKGEAFQIDCGSVTQKCFEPWGTPCRPRWRCLSKTSCEPGCGIEMKGEPACQKEFVEGAEQKEAKEELGIQKQSRKL